MHPCHICRDDTKLGGPVNILGGGAAIQRDTDGLEEMGQQEHTEFNKDKCKALRPAPIQAGDH